MKIFGQEEVREFSRRIKMGYNISRFSVNRNLPQLDLLLKAQTDIRFETAHPRKLSYKLREALHASREFDDLKHYYETITPNFTFKEEPNAVVATYNPVPVGIPVGPVDVQSNSKVDGPSKGSLDGARTLIDVIGGGVEGDERGYEELHFPNAILSQDDIKKLWDWTETTSWGLIDHQEKGLTLTKSEKYNDFFWSPE